MTPETLNQWRVVPRLIVLGFGWLVWDVSQWYMALPDPSGSQAAFVSTIVGSAAIVTNFYVNSGGSS